MSVTAPRPDHLLSLAEWDELPEGLCRRSELVEGVLHVVPSPAALHQVAVAKMCAELNQQLPADLFAVPYLDVVLEISPLTTVRKPDLVVVATELVESNPARIIGAQVLVAIEIVSPGSGRTDRVTKMAEYAEAGIEHYWIVELGPPVSLATYLLPPTRGAYVDGPAGSESIEIAVPASIRLELGDLIKR